MNNLTINLLVLVASFFIINPILFAFMKGTKKWGNYWLIWFSTLVVSGLVLWLLISKPDSVPQALSSVFNITNSTQ